MKNITLISSSKKICTIEPIRSLSERDSITSYDDALLEGKVDINSLSLTIIQKNIFQGIQTTTHSIGWYCKEWNIYWWNKYDFSKKK